MGPTLGNRDVLFSGLGQLTWSNSRKWTSLPGFAQSWARLPGFAKLWARLPGPFVLHRARLPGTSNLRVRLPGFAKPWTRLPGKRNVRTRLPRPQFCKGGPGYLVDQITWSRPKVGQIAWSRPVGPREMAFATLVLARVRTLQGRAISARAQEGSDTLPPGPPLLRGRCALAPGAERNPGTVCSQCVARPGARPRRSKLPMYTSGVREAFRC